jgi:hypothetical protein
LKNAQSELKIDFQFLQGVAGEFMKVIRFAFIMLSFLCCVFAYATGQESPRQKGAREITVWAGGGTGVGASDGTQMMNAGVRLGKVLTGEHGSGALRGNLEYAFDVAPLYLFFQDQNVNGVVKRQTVYGGSISPVVVKWNFTSGKRIVPFVGVEGSAILTSKNVPAGDTSQVNFGSGVAAGMQFLRGQSHAMSFSGHLMHISNASIGNHNPGVNVALQFRLGYQWWK